MVVLVARKKKGREPNAPPLEAPRSAFGKKHAEPRPMGRALRRLFPLLKIRGFLVEPSRYDAKFEFVLLHSQTDQRREHTFWRHIAKSKGRTE